MTMLHEFGLIYSNDDERVIRKETRLGHVVLVGSDVDRDIFGVYLPDGLIRVPEHLTLYESTADKALGISEMLLGYRRLGQYWSDLSRPVKNYIRKNPRLTMVNVSHAVEFDSGNGHGYFLKSPWVSSDALMVLRYGLAPVDRGLVMQPDVPIWEFPNDYVQRLKAALAKASLRRIEADRASSQ